MIKKYPNSSILTIITQSENENSNKVLFFYLKPVPDYTTEKKIHWFEDKGKDGKASIIWDNYQIKQWVAFGLDSVISELFESIITKNEIIIGKKKILLQFPIFERHSNKNNILCDRTENIYDSFSSPYNMTIPIAFYQKGNLDFLSGYKTNSSEIKPLYPLGFFEQDFIYNNLNKGIWGIKEYRTAYLTFHGVKQKSVKGVGSTEMAGFYQQNFEKKTIYKVIFKNEQDEQIGEADIDISTGLFNAELKEPSKGGKVEIHSNGKIEKYINYTLIQDIKIDVNLTSTTFNDSYGRSFMFSSEKTDKPKTISNTTWQRNVYSDNIEANKALSDIFRNIFNYLGPNIVIADPYFIGVFDKDKINNNIAPRSDCQIAILNALAHSAIENKGLKLSILGCFKRASNQIESSNDAEIAYNGTIKPQEINQHIVTTSKISTEIKGKVNAKTDEILILIKTREGSNTFKIDDLFDNYERFFNGFISKNKIEKYLQTNSITFLNAMENFHNRYWFSIKEENGFEVLDKCVIVTNSIGNLNELDIIDVTNEMQLKQITRRYTNLYKNAEIKRKI
jgi:hypothetical protein